MNSIKKNRNIGVMAHVDAGKTTLTEQLLYESGAIRSAGRVDHGTSITDSLEVERARGITVKAASAALNWQGVNIRIIDTPGHADFYPEVERSIRVLDGAILVISAVEGIQLQTLNIWSALRELGVPTLIFVNKLDRVGADPVGLLHDIKKQLSPDIIPIQKVQGFATKEAQLVSVKESPDVFRDAVESIANFDEQIMAQYAADIETSQELLEKSIASYTQQGKVFPVFFGVALAGLGVPEMLDGIVNYLPPPIGSVDKPLSAVVYKVEVDKALGRGLHVRVFEGRITQRSQVANHTTSAVEKCTQLQQLNVGGGYLNVERIDAGDTGVIYGLKASRIGHILGSDYAVPEMPTATEPMLVARIYPKADNQWNQLLEALQQLEDEDPLLSIEWREREKEINLRFFGEVQMEIVSNLLSTRFSLDSEFSDPCVIYKETPATIAEASIEYRDGGYADLRLRIEPLESGAGFEYESLISGDNKIYQKFMKQIPQLLEQQCLLGPNGREVTDIKVSLVDGYCKYDLGTQANDYKIVTPIVFQQALERAGTMTLEPVMDFQIRVPEEYGAQIYRDLLKMRATFEQPLPDHGWLVFSGMVPFAETYEYTAVLYASSHGQGVLKTTFQGYFPVR